MAERLKCEMCGDKYSPISVVTVICDGETKHIWICEKCQDKLEKPFKNENK